MKKLFALLILLFSAPLVLAQGVSLGPGIGFQGGGGGGNTFVINGGAVGIGQFSVDAFIQAESLPVSDGTFNVAQPFADAAQACGAAGGGQIIFSNRRYLIDTGSTQNVNGITIPTGCQVYCPVSSTSFNHAQSTQMDFSQLQYAIILNSAVSINFLNASGWQGCSVLQKAVANFSMLTASTVRAYLDLRAAFAGIAFTLGVDNVTYGADVTIRDTFIGGFNWGIAPGNEGSGYTTYLPNATASHVARMSLTNVKIDAINGVWVDQSHDVSSMYQVEVFPFMTTNNKTIMSPAYGIASIGDSPGSPGTYRVVTTVPTGVQTGDTVYIANPGSTLNGVPSAQNRWVANVIDSSTIDLVGSNSGALTGLQFTGTVSAGSQIISGISQADIIKIGTSVTGNGSVIAGVTCAAAPFAGIPSGAKVISMTGSVIQLGAGFPDGAAILLDQPATVSCPTGATLTATDPPYVSGGSVRLDASARPGYGIYGTNSEGLICFNCFVYGHYVEYYAGSAMLSFDCSLCGGDNGAADTDDPNTIGFLASNQPVGGGGQNNDHAWMGGSLISDGQPFVYFGSNGGIAARFIGMTFHENHSGRFSMQHLDGSLTLIGNSEGAAQSRYAYISNVADGPTLVGNGWGTNIYWQPGGTGISIGTSQEWANRPSATSTNQYMGRMQYNGRLILGGKSANNTCVGQATTCSVNFRSNVNDNNQPLIEMVEGATDNIPDFSYTVYFNSAVPLTNYHTRLQPVAVGAAAPEAGQLLSMYFSNSIANMVWSYTGSGLPSSIAANTWVNCQRDAANTKWLCTATAPQCGQRTFTAGGAAPVTVTSNDCTILIDKTGHESATAVNLQATPPSGQRLLIKDAEGNAATTGPITITPASGTIDGAATKVINTAYGQCSLLYSGTTWTVIGPCT